MEIRPFLIAGKWFLAHGVHEYGPRRQLVARGYWQVTSQRWVPTFSNASVFSNEQEAAAHLEANRSYLIAELDR